MFKKQVENKMSKIGNKKICLKINKKIGIYRAGDTVTIDADANGWPVSYEWRARLRDAQIDKCCEIISPTYNKNKKQNKGGTE
jgi:hypothetical protein